MATEFSFEHVFTAPSTKVVLASYFNPDHLAAQDKVGALCDRAVVDDHDDDAVRRCSWSVRAQRSLPLFVRPLVEGGHLSYLEAMVWRKADDEIDLTVTPRILGGRIQIAGKYQLSSAGEGRVRRRYAGTITVNVAMISGKIERGILSEFTKGMPMMTECTQQWLSRSGS